MVTIKSHSDMTIKELRWKAEKLLSLPLNTHQIIHGKVNLLETKTLSDYHITSPLTITLIPNEVEVFYDPRLEVGETVGKTPQRIFSDLESSVVWDVKRSIKIYCHIGNFNYYYLYYL